MAAVVYQAVQAFEPFFAPFSKPLILQALELQKEAPGETSAPLPAASSPYALLRTRMIEPRQKTFEDLATVVKDGKFDTDYLLAKLTEFTPKKTPENTSPLSAESLSHWRKAGLIRYQAKNAPDYDSGAALLTLRRMVQHKERRWLPSPAKQARHQFLNEPLWWCWRQDSLSSPVVPCPVPLPPDIPPYALLWTDWRGAAWKPEWLPVGEIGCCRWAGTKLFEDANQTSTLLWAMSEEELAEHWQIPISGFYKQALAATPLTLHSLATSALLLLGIERLEELQEFNPASLPLAV